MIRALVFAQFGSFGGTRAYLVELLRLLKSQNIEVILCGLSDADEEMEALCESLGFVCHDFPSAENAGSVFNIQHLIFGRFREQRAMKRLQLIHRPDLVIASASTPGVFLGSRHGFHPDVYILHSYPVDNRTGIRGWLKRKAINFRMPVKMKYLTVSSYSRSQLIQCWGLTPKRFFTKVIYNTAADLALPRVASSTTPLVVTIGHVTEYKNPLLWIRVARDVIKKVSDARFIWVGDGDLLEFCKAKVQDLGIEDQVAFVGRNDDVVPILQIATVYFQPSQIENCSIAVLEAMRSGVPCVVSNRGGLPELVEDGVTGMVVELQDESGIAHTLSSLLRDKGRQKRFGKSGAKRYREMFGPERWKEETLTFLGLNQVKGNTK